MSQGAQTVICPATKIVAATRGFTALLGVPLTTDQASRPGFRAGATIRDRITDVGGRQTRRDRGPTPAAASSG